MEQSDYLALIKKCVINGKLSKRRFTEITGIPSSRVITSFGSWNKAKKAAGITTVITKDSILSDFADYYASNNKLPTIRNKDNIPSQPTIVKFFGSWNAFIEVAKELYGIDQCTCPYCFKKFSSYLRVSKHCNSCSSNDHTYYIDITYGSIHYSELLNKRTEEIRAIYPQISSLFTINKYFLKYGITINYSNCYFSKEVIISKIQEYVSKYSEIPSSKAEFRKPIDNFPTLPTILRYFKSWNEAIKVAGFTPSTQQGFGVVTTGLDNHCYRSRAEAYFADKFLYNTYDYVIEPKYANDIWFYDWYIPSINLYIELDGGIRPWRIEQKKLYNSVNNIPCIYVPTKIITDYNKLEELIYEIRN